MVRTRSLKWLRMRARRFGMISPALNVMKSVSHGCHTTRVVLPRRRYVAMRSTIGLVEPGVDIALEDVQLAVPIE